MRILGITIPKEKRLEIGLTAIYGIGRPKALEVLARAGVPAGMRPKEVSTEKENEIRKFIDELTLEGSLKREIATNVKRLKDISAYRGTRHAKRLPVRGQNTKTNTRTVRGNVRKTMGSGKTKTDKK